MPMLRVVGGAVRNYLLGFPIKDIDFATVWTPEEVQEKCRTAGVKTVPTGIDHGTITVVLDGVGFEVTTLRKDVETDGRRAVIAYSQSWGEDASRRDFTINALYMDLSGEVFDPLGGGLQDIKAGIVRFIGDADERIKEDALRILRFYRFSLFYGKNGLDQTGVNTCIENSDLLQNLSRERVTDEVLKVCTYDMSVEKSVDIFNIMLSNHNVNLFGSVVQKSDILRRCLSRQTLYAQPCSLAVLFSAMGGDVELIKSALILSRKQIQFLERLHMAHEAYDLSVKKCLYHYGLEVGLQALFLREGVSDQDISFAKGWDLPVFPLAGQDLLKAGMTTGPEIGEVLRKTEAWWVSQDFYPSKSECVSFALGCMEEAN